MIKYTHTCKMVISFIFIRKKSDFVKTMPAGTRPGSGGGGQSAGVNQGNKGLNKNAQPRAPTPTKMSDVYEAAAMSEPCTQSEVISVV